MSPERELAIAKRCQLLIGSCGGETECPCQSPAQCVLAKERREHYRGMNEIQELRERNYQTFKSQQGEGDVTRTDQVS